MSLDDIDDTAESTRHVARDRLDQARADVAARYGALCGRQHRYGFAQLWESINGPGSWDANPWVWAITFRRLEPPA